MKTNRKYQRKKEYPNTTITKIQLPEVGFNCCRLCILQMKDTQRNKLTTQVNQLSYIYWNSWWPFFGKNHKYNSSLSDLWMTWHRHKWNHVKNAICWLFLQAKDALAVNCSIKIHKHVFRNEVNIWIPYQWAANGLQRSKWNGRFLSSFKRTEASTYINNSHIEIVGKPRPRSAKKKQQSSEKSWNYNNMWIRANREIM